MATIFLFINPNAECRYCTGEYADILVFAHTKEQAVEHAAHLTQYGSVGRSKSNYWVDDVEPTVVGYSDNLETYATGRWMEHVDCE